MHLLRSFASDSDNGQTEKWMRAQEEREENYYVKTKWSTQIAVGVAQRRPHIVPIMYRRWRENNGKREL